MNKLIVCIAVALVTLMGNTRLTAQKKNVDAAWRLVGKTESVGEARKLIKEAMKDPKTANQARTYFVAAMIEWRSYDADVRKREINPKDGSVKDADMNAKILDGYRYLLKALPLDSLPDKKGKVKPKYSREIKEMLDSRAYDIYRAGALCYNAGKYYPDAYQGFMASATIASDPVMKRASKLLPDSVRANIFYFAGLSAYGGKHLKEALKAFEKAEQAGLYSDTLYLYTMAIWEQLARDSVNLQPMARDSLLSISQRAYRRHGIKEPDFLSRMTQIYISEGKTDSIMPVLDKELEKSPDSWLPRAMRGWVYESMGNTSSAIADYKLAAEYPEISPKMLMRAAHLLYRTAHALKDDISGNRKQRKKAADKLIDDYLNPAFSMAKRAREKSSDARDLELINNILEAVDYDISLLK